MKEYYLVDGYNVINNWPEFAGIRDKDLEHARDLLTDQVAGSNRTQPWMHGRLYR